MKQNPAPLRHWQKPGPQFCGCLGERVLQESITLFLVWGVRGGGGVECAGRAAKTVIDLHCKEQDSEAQDSITVVSVVRQIAESH